MTVQIANLGLFLLEAVIYFTVMTTFLHFRRQLGLGVFLTALGVMHFMETYLAAVFYVDLPSGLVSPGSSIFFAGKLMMILLLYLKEDAATVRQPIYGLFLGNLLTVGIAQVLQWHAAVTLPVGRPADMHFLGEMGWLMIWGTALLYVDAIGLILIYERLGPLLRRHTVIRLALSGAIVLSFDQVGFYAVLHYLLAAPPSVFFGGWYAKLIAVACYSVMFAVYLRIEKLPKTGRSGRQIGDVFNDLTFRERYQALLESSGTDRLTGIYDRSRLERDAPGLIRESLERRQALSLMIIDADEFKEVNDLFGHLQGDETLRQLAGRLKAIRGSGDHLSRFGGEEFVLISPEKDHSQALALANALRDDVCRSIRRPDGRAITVSVGVATAPEDGETLDTLLAAADARLYRAKNDGRDNVHGRHGKLSVMSEQVGS